MGYIRYSRHGTERKSTVLQTLADEKRTDSDNKIKTERNTKAEMSEDINGGL